MAPPIKYPIVNGEKECGVCHQWKPISEYKRARKHYTARCKDCEKEYKAEYIQRPEVRAHQLEYTRRYRSDDTNRMRINANSRKYKKQPENKVKRNITRREWTANEKRKAVEYKGGKCCICSYNDCMAALEFHHINPTLKEGYGTGALKAHWTFEKNIPELDKCVLVCARCHREIHAGMHPEYLNE